MDTEKEMYQAQITQYKENIKNDPGDLTSYYNWLMAIASFGLPEDELNEYGKAIEDNLNTADAFNEFGDFLTDNGKYENALSQYQKTLQKDSSNIHAMASCGFLLHQLNQDQEAIEYYKNALKLDPDYSYAYHSWGISLGKLGHHEEAIEKYQEALLRDSENISIYNNLGTALDNLGRYEEAIEQYQKALDRNPDYVDAHHNMGIALDKLERHEEALEQYDKVLSYNPEYVDAYYNSGLALNSLGRYEDAIEQFRKVLLKDKKTAPVYNSWGTSLHNLGRYQEAIELYEMALKQDPEYIVAYNNLGLALDSLGRYEEAIEQYRQALEKDPDNVFAHGSLGYSLDKLGRFNEAIEKYKEVLTRDKSNVAAYNSWGITLYNLRRFEEAIEKYKDALQNNPDYIDAYNNLGLALEQLGRYDEAIEQYDKALEKDSRYLFAHFNKGLALEKLSRYEEGIAEYQKAYEKDSYYAYAAHNIASINERTGALKEAAKWWNNAAKAYEKGSDKAKNSRDISHFYYHAQLYHYSFKTDFNKAKEIYLNGLALDPQNSLILLGLARLYLDLKNQEIEFSGEKPLVEIKSEGHWKALEYLNKLKNILKKQIEQKQDSYLFLDLGEVYFLMGETYFDRAIHYLKHALQKIPNTPNIAETLALISLQQGHFKKAISYFEQELAVSPDDLNILCMLADACLKANLKEKAESIYKEILDINQNHLKALLGLGEIYTQKGERDKDSNEHGFAIENFSQALDYYARAFKVDEMFRSYFERGLNSKEMGTLLYSNAYAKVMLYESQQGRNKNPRLLIEAKNDFTKIKNQYKNSQNYYRADAASKKIVESLRPSQESTTKLGAKVVFAFSCMLFLVAQFCFIFGQPIFGSSYAINNDRLHKIMSEAKTKNIQFGADIEKILNDLAKRQFTSLDNFLVIISKTIEETTKEKGEIISQEAFKYLSSEIDANDVLQRRGSLRFVGFLPLTPPYYALISFGSLLCMAAGLYLRETTRFKVGAIELEKRSTEQPTTPSSLGISRGLTGMSKR
jgi:tetratricopeptide (TPR) repeat protein